MILNYIDEELGGWHVLNKNNSIKANLSTLDKLIKLRFIGIKPLFDLSVMSNPKNPTLSVLRLRQPSYLLNKEHYNNFRTEFVIKGLLLKVIQFLNSTTNSTKDDVDNMFEIEKKLGLVL